LINNFATEPILESEEVVIIDTSYVKSFDLILPQTQKRYKNVKKNGKLFSANFKIITIFDSFAEFWLII
jgi:hypothetical protein